MIIVRQEDLLVNNINIMYGHEKTHVIKKIKSMLMGK
jgi:hypothetical protein